MCSKTFSKTQSVERHNVSDDTSCTSDAREEVSREEVSREEVPREEVLRRGDTRIGAPRAFAPKKELQTNCDTRMGLRLMPGVVNDTTGAVPQPGVASTCDSAHGDAQCARQAQSYATDAAVKCL